MNDSALTGREHLVAAVPADSIITVRIDAFSLDPSFYHHSGTITDRRGNKEFDLFSVPSPVGTLYFVIAYAIRQNGVAGRTKAILTSARP